MGDASIFELLENDLKRGDAFGIGLADDDGRVARRERERAFMLEFDGAGAIYEGEGVAEEAHVGDVEGDAHAVVAGFGARVADRRLVGDGTGPLNGAAAGQNGFEERGLTAQIGADECDAAGADAPIGP